MNLQACEHIPGIRSLPFLLWAGTFLLLAGCGLSPLHGGRATRTYHPAGGITQSLIQGDNPSEPTTQTQEQIKLRTYVLPAGTRVEAPPANLAAHPDAAARSTFIVPAPVPVTEREESRSRTELGAAQKDTARELGVRLSSLKGIVWVGAALFVVGLASLFWPPLKAIIASTTTSLAITLGGTALIVLPTLIVGHELLIGAGVALVVGAWFIAHRHGHAQGQLRQLRAEPPNLDRA